MQDASIAKRGWDQDGHPQGGFDEAASSARRFPSKAEAGKARRYNTEKIGSGERIFVLSLLIQPDEKSHPQEYGWLDWFADWLGWMPYAVRLRQA